MILLMKAAGLYEVHDENGFVGEIRKFKIKLAEKIKYPNGGYSYSKEWWVYRPKDVPFGNLTRYKTFGGVVLDLFPAGFENNPGPNKILKNL